jgi:hypothetical protein
LKLRLSSVARRLLARLHVLHARAVTRLDGAAGELPSTTIKFVTIRAAATQYTRH